MVYDVDEAGATCWDVTLEDVSVAAYPLNLQVAKALFKLMSGRAQKVTARCLAWNTKAV